MKAIRFILLILLTLNLAAGCRAAPIPGAPTAANTPESELRVLFLNVGRADATLVLAAGKAWLIDTGEKSSVPQLLRGLHVYGVEALDGVFLTHTHGDHIGGMGTLAQNFPIGTLYSAEISENKKGGGNKIDELAQEFSLNHRKLRAGDGVDITPDVRFEVLGPLVYNDQDDNDNSLVLRLRMNGRTLLFTGDMQFAEEATLMQAGADLKADILKVANHGNPDATSDAFAAAVLPQYAVIPTDTSVDEDSANPRVTAALAGATVLVTQDYACGALITVGADGSIAIANPEAPHTGARMTITKIDKDAQTVTIRNDGEGMDISGFFLLSQKGSEVFMFPKGAHLNAGQTVTVSGEGGGGDYEWVNDSKVWNTKKEDVGVLYDRYGNELAREAS